MNNPIIRYILEVNLFVSKEMFLRKRSYGIRNFMGKLFDTRVRVPVHIYEVKMRVPLYLGNMEEGGKPQKPLL